MNNQQYWIDRQYNQRLTTTNNYVGLINNTTNNAQLQPNDQYNQQQSTTTNNGQPTTLD